MVDRVLDRIPQFDEKSRAFNVRQILEVLSPRSYTWRNELNLDQGPDGACVGFAWAHEAASRPVPVANLGYHDAFAVYKDAQKIDPWPGEDYSGTSVLAGAKVAKERGWLKEYRWAFNTNDALAAISRHGPVVLGINWYDGMFDTDENGFIAPTGRIAGGHAIIARGVSKKDETVLLHNSWGRNWGGTKWGPGTALLTWDNLDRLLHEDGEACVPVFRSKP